MKRFLISFVIGMTLIAAGATMTFFELQKYKVVDIQDVEGNKTEFFTLEENEKLNITLDEGNFSMRYDDTLKDNEIKIIVHEKIAYKINKNNIEIYNDDEDMYGFAHNTIGKFIEGLKEHKLYTDQISETVLIYTNPNSRDRVRVNR